MPNTLINGCDFSAQEKMLLIATNLIALSNIKSPCTFGGGTALSAYYWQHRFSTDIDMFIHTEGSEKSLDLVRPLLRNDQIKKQLEDRGYNENIKESGIRFPGHYLEISINKHEKIQFFQVGDIQKHHIVSVQFLDKQYLLKVLRKSLQKRFFTVQIKQMRGIYLIFHLLFIKTRCQLKEY